MDLTVGNTLGALSIGFSISSMLYGVLLVQIYDYCRRYPSDKVGYKAAVILLLLLETTHQALIGHCVYYYSVTNFSNALVLFGLPVWSLVFQLPIAVVIGSIVKFFFSLRIWRFSNGNVWLMVFLSLLNVGQLSLAITFTAKSYALRALPFTAEIRTLGIVSLGINTLDDISTAVALCYYLQTMRTSYTRVNSLIRNLTIYAVSTGVMTSALNFSILIIYHFMPTNFVFVGCYFVLSKLYSVSFVAALNTRQIANTSDPKRSSIATLQRSPSFSTPLRSPRGIRDSRDVCTASSTLQTPDTIDPKRSSATPAQRGRSFSIPLRSPRVVRDSQDVESHAGENRVSILLHH